MGSSASAVVPSRRLSGRAASQSAHALCRASSSLTASCHRWGRLRRSTVRRGRVGTGDGGATWDHVGNGLPGKDITSVSFDSTNRRLLATSDTTGVIFVSRDGGRTWQRGPDSGFPLRRVSVIGGRFVGATPFDGVILQPENEPISAAADTGSSE